MRLSSSRRPSTTRPRLSSRSEFRALGAISLSRPPRCAWPTAMAAQGCCGSILTVTRSCSSDSGRPCTTWFLIPERHDVMCDVAARFWRPVVPECRPADGRRQGTRVSDLLPRLWEETGRACSEATVEDALACMERRRRAHDDRHAVLVHGDVHDLNALQAADGTSSSIDPVGLRAERACDLGTIIRCNPDAGDDLHARAKRLAARTGVDATAIWEWGTIHRVIGGLYSRKIGLQPFGDLLIAQADLLTR